MPSYRDHPSRALSRRRFLQLIGATSLSGLLVACGGDDDEPMRTVAETGATPTAGSDSTGTTPAVPTTAQETSTTGSESFTSGELRVAAPQDRHSTSGLVNIGMSIPNANTFETLVALSPDFQPVPMLAESWEFIEPNTWRFVLREGVTFHDGTPFTAEAVQWTMARVAASGGGVLGVGEDSVKVVDDYTVEITPSKENQRLVLQLAAPRTGSIIAPNTDVDIERIGTGPFREVEYVRDEHQIVEAFDDYWGEKAKVSRITFRYIPDPTTRILALRAGEADIAYDVPRESTQEISSGEGLQLVTSEVGAYQALYFNIHGTEPYDLGQDPRVRQAVAFAIDKDAIVHGVYQGNAEINNTMVPTGVLGDAAEMIEGTGYDPDRARQILDEAGWVDGSGDIREKDGRQLKLTMIVGFPSAELHQPMPEFVQAQLQEVGIDLEIVQTPDIGIYEARLQSGEGDLWAEVGNQVDSDPCYLPGLLFYSPMPGGDPESAMYANAFALGEKFDRFIDRCGAVSEIKEVQEAAANAMKVLIDEEHVVIPLAGVVRIYGVSDKIEGFEAHPVQFVQRWNGVSIKADA